jgi:DNA-binding NtrC family response regulator
MTEETAKRPPVLFVDDGRDIRELLEVWQKSGRLPFEPVFAHSQDEALAVVHSRPIVAAVIDMNLMGESGASVAEQLHEHYPHILKMFLTAYDRSVAHENAEEFGMDVLAKPIDIQDLVNSVMSLLRGGKPVSETAPRPRQGGGGPVSMPHVLRSITGSIFIR